MGWARGNTRKTIIRTSSFALWCIGGDISHVMILVIFEVTYHKVIHFQSCRYRIVQSTGQISSLKSRQRTHAG